MTGPHTRSGQAYPPGCTTGSSSSQRTIRATSAGAVKRTGGRRPSRRSTWRAPAGTASRGDRATTQTTWASTRSAVEPSGREVAATSRMRLESRPGSAGQAKPRPEMRPLASVPALSSTSREPRGRCARSNASTCASGCGACQRARSSTTAGVPARWNGERRAGGGEASGVAPGRESVGGGGRRSGPRSRYRQEQEDRGERSHLPDDTAPGARTVTRLLPVAARADGAAGRVEVALRRRLERRLAEHLVDDPDVLGRSDDVRDPSDRLGGPAQPAVDRAARAELDPGELQELPGGEVGGDRSEQRAAVEGQAEEQRGARQLAQRRLLDELLVVLAGEVRPGGVELVLADPREDQGLVAVHVRRPLVETPAGPAQAPLPGGVRAVEPVREDVLGHVYGDPADRVDQLLELVEVDDHDVVDGQRPPDERVDRADGEPRPAELHGRVDLLLTVARHLGAQVARDREEDEPVPAGVGVEEGDRVGVLVAAAAE